jgi:hypothetical protein
MIFFRCNSGHFFSGKLCPRDGWSDPGIFKIWELEERLWRSGKRTTIKSLREAGADEAFIKRVVVIEFGDLTAAFEAVSPEQVVLNGQVKNLLDLGREFK